MAFLGAEPHHDIFLSEFGVHLAELTVDPQGALAIRQVSPDQSVQLQSHFSYLVMKLSKGKGKEEASFRSPGSWYQVQTVRRRGQAVCVVPACEAGLLHAVHRGLPLSPAGLRHSEAVRGDPLVRPVREVQAAGDHREGEDSIAVCLPGGSGAIHTPARPGAGRRLRRREGDGHWRRERRARAALFLTPAPLFLCWR